MIIAVAGGVYLIVVLGRAGRASEALRGPLLSIVDLEVTGEAARGASGAVGVFRTFLALSGPAAAEGAGATRGALRSVCDAWGELRGSTLSDCKIHLP